MAKGRALIPTKKDLLKLPRCARVAFAARCARRTLPFIYRWKEALKTHVSVLHNAIEIVENTARNGRAEIPLMIVAATDVADAVSKAHELENGDTYYAARTVLLAVETITLDSAGAAHEAAINASLAQAELLHDIMEAEFEDEVIEQMVGAARNVEAIRTWHDYDRLLALATKEEWTDDSPVDPDWLGQIWPHGRPEGWEEPFQYQEDAAGLTLTLDIPDGTSDEEAERMVVDYIDHLDTLHRALGGHGLRVLPPMEVNEPARTAQGVGS